jgi:hypothetical protein
MLNYPSFLTPRDIRHSRANELRWSNSNDGGDWTAVEAEHALGEPLRALAGHIPSDLRNSVFVVGYAAFVLHMTHQDTRVSETIRRFEYPRIKHVEVYTITHTVQSFRDTINYFLLHAFGSSLLYELKTYHNVTVDTFGFRTDVCFATFLFKPIGYKFIRLPEGITEADLLRRQPFSIYRIKFDFKLSKSKPSAEATDSIRSGLVASHSHYVNSVFPTHDEISRFNKLLRRMQSFHRKGWTFINYPTITNDTDY